MSVLLSLWSMVFDTIYCVVGPQNCKIFLVLTKKATMFFPYKGHSYSMLMNVF